MFCPVCKYEFRRGFTHCNTCDADLVDALPPEEEVDHTLAASPSQSQLDRPILLWSGASGGFYSSLTLALHNAQIPYNKEELDARLVFTSQHADLEVWVATSNFSQAETIRDALMGSPQYANDASVAQVAQDDQGEDDASAAIPAEDDEGADDIRHESVARELYPEDAAAEVWSGADEALADALKSCLAEIGINCYLRTPDSEENAGSDIHTNKPVASSGSAHSESDGAAASRRQPFAICVLPEDEARAREIVREVTDGAPPQ